MKSNNQVVRFWRNGSIIELADVKASTTLLELLRDPGSPAPASCMGTKEGCGEGDCGACTVVIGEPDPAGTALKLRAVNSCIRLAHSIDGLALWTVTDIGQSAAHPVQQAMVECHASQCGFCTPGFVMSLFALYHSVEPGTTVSRETAQEVLSGNLCRCTGYRPILDAAMMMMSLPPRSLDAQGIAAQLRTLAPSRADAPVGGSWRPHSLNELLTLRSAHPDAQLIAGCTDVGLWITKQHRVFDEVIDVTAVQALHGITRNPQGLRIGAAARLPEVFAALCEERPQLKAFSARFAGLPIRNSATLGGNVANGSPIGDSMPLLIALGAQVVLGSVRGERSLPLEDFYLGYRQTALAADEVVVWIDIPAPTPHQFTRIYKLSKRFDDDISAVCLAITLDFDSAPRAGQDGVIFNGAILGARIGVGGMAATPMRAQAAEAALIGQAWSLQAAQSAGHTLTQSFQPISDMRASSLYRSQAIGRLMHRLWIESQGISANLESLDKLEQLPDSPGITALRKVLELTP
jgi:xanthine dehydrogenase small subunit